MGDEGSEPGQREEGDRREVPGAEAGDWCGARRGRVDARRRGQCQVPAQRLHKQRLDAVHPARARLDPLRLAEEILECRRQRHAVDPYRDDRVALRGRALDLLADVHRVDRILREEEDEHPGGVERRDDAVGVAHAGRDVARCDPAADAAAFEAVDETLRGHGVLRGVAQEHLRGRPALGRTQGSGTLWSAALHRRK
jgi:hypothetical protein